EQVNASIRRRALEVHLENPDQTEPRDDVAPEPLELGLAREAQVGAVAGERGICADLASDERGQELAARRGKAVEAPDRAVVARHVFLKRELCGELAHESVVIRRAPALEDARLARAAEELLAHRGVLPAEPR